MKNKILCIVFSILLLSSAICVSAEQSPAREITITSVEEFLEFTDNCRLDSYSQGTSMLTSQSITTVVVNFVIFSLVAKSLIRFTNSDMVIGTSEKANSLRFSTGNENGSFLIFFCGAVPPLSMTRPRTSAT